MKKQIIIFVIAFIIGYVYCEWIVHNYRFTSICFWECETSYAKGFAEGWQMNGRCK